MPGCERATLLEKVLQAERVKKSKLDPSQTALRLTFEHQTNETKKATQLNLKKAVNVSRYHKETLKRKKKLSNEPQKS